MKATPRHKDRPVQQQRAASAALCFCFAVAVAFAFLVVIPAGSCQLGFPRDGVADLSVILETDKPVDVGMSSVRTAYCFAVLANASVQVIAHADVEVREQLARMKWYSRCTTHSVPREALRRI